MCNYTTEYSYDYEDYKKIVKEQPVGMSSWGDYDFKFYEIRFYNNVIVYLFEEREMINSYIKLQNIDNSVIKYVGHIDDINIRIVTESINRDQDFIDECKNLTQYEEMLLLAPFKFSWEKTYDDL